MEYIPSISRSGGLDEGGDALKDRETQEKFRSYIQNKIRGYRTNYPYDSKSIVEKRTSAQQAAQENIIILLRKLREGIISSKRVDTFAIQVYETSVFICIEFQSQKHAISASSHLLPALYAEFDSKHPSTGSDSREFIAALSLLNDLTTSYPSQTSFHNQLTALNSSILPLTSITRVWIQELAAAIRRGNYALFYRLSQPGIAAGRLEINEDNLTRVLSMSLHLLRTKLRADAWTVFLRVYLEIVDTHWEWIGRSIGMEREEDVREWLWQKQEAGDLQEKVGGWKVRKRVAHMAVWNDTDLSRETQRTLRTLAVTYALLITSNSLRSGLSKYKSRRQQDSVPNISSGSIKTASFPAIFPLTYRTIARLLGPASPYGPLAVSSPLLLLLSPSVRTHVALYLASSALSNTAKQSSLRKFLPPVWILNVAGNAWLLWMFLNERSTFPKTYSKVVVDHSHQYVPDPSKLEEQLAFLNTTHYPPCDAASAPPGAHAKHTRLLCARLHPSNPSCLSTYLHAWVEESARVWRWTGGFGLLSLLLTRRGKLLKDPLWKTFLGWALSTARSTAFVVGSINTSWALACVFQRILSGNTLPRSRWLLNGALASLWILILPKGRRSVISLYVARQAIFGLYDTYKKKSGTEPKFPEVLVFAFAWAALIRSRKEGIALGGLVNRALNFVEEGLPQVA